MVKVFTPTQFYFQLKKEWYKSDSLELDINYFFSNYRCLDELRFPPNQRSVGVKGAVIWNVGGQEYGACEVGGVFVSIMSCGNHSGKHRANSLMPVCRLVVYHWW